MEADRNRPATIIEGLTRRNTNAIERAEKIAALMRDQCLSETEISLAVGYSLPWVCNHLRLLRLPSDVIGLMRDGALTFADGKALANLSARDADVLARRRVANGWTSKRLEQEVRELRKLSQGETPGDPAEASE